MKPFKIILFLLSLSLLFTGSYIIFEEPKNTAHLNPISENNNYRQNLEKALSLANLKPQYISPREFINEIEFNLNGTLVVLSTQKDPFWQVSSLQDILKIAKINHQVIKFIDLSPAHPYATAL
jgi:hypothetical protein